MIRVCRVCLVEKDLELFPTAKHGKLGRRNQCTDCRKAYHRDNSKKYYQTNKVVKIAKVMAYQIGNDLYQAKTLARRASPEFRESERIRSASRRKDVSGNPHRAYLTRRYLARKFNAKGYTTRVQLKARWDYYGHKCWICKLTASETDHVIPLSKGGSNWPANLRPICKQCNVRKGNKWPYKPSVTI
jgi:5-methylcytosine-specific restriction endonuclease McrA